MVSKNGYNWAQYIKVMNVCEKKEVLLWDMNRLGSASIRKKMKITIIKDSIRVSMVDGSKKKATWKKSEHFRFQYEQNKSR